MANQKGIDPTGKKASVTSNEGALAGTHIVYSEESKQKMLDSDEKGDELTEDITDENPTDFIPGNEDSVIRDNGSGFDRDGSLEDMNSPLDTLDEEISDKEGTVSKEEEELLQRAANFMPTPDEEGLHNATLDDTDEEGDPLNENNEDISGSDLDIPGSEFDDAAEDIGEEDEENNSYSLGGDSYD